jgi:hypothetical protein
MLSPFVEVVLRRRAPALREHGSSQTPAYSEETYMKVSALAGVVVLLLAGAAACQAQEAPEMPAPEKEHEWLAQLVGEWNSEGEVQMAPGQPPIKCQGTESVRAIGGFWIIATNNGTFMEMPTTGVLTLGYDPEQKKYVGTWVDSMTSYLWKYEGAVDDSGKILTLLAEGPNPMAPGQTMKFRDMIELKSKDHKVLTSSVQTDDGQWQTFMTMNYRRKGSQAGP